MKRFLPRRSFPRLALERGPAIYVLVDPRDGTVRYVGFTRGSLALRLDRHAESPVNEAMAYWFKELSAVGARPTIHAIAVVEIEGWQRAEMFWIAWARRRGLLYNVDPGGQYRDERGRVSAAGRKAAEKMLRIVANGKRRPPSNRPASPQRALSARLAEISRRQMQRFKQERASKSPVAGSGARPIVSGIPRRDPPKKV